ncbi:MAG TPA: hypothetical protein VLZ74_03185 [Methylocella sp.]|nr:hypothetical protein [Methylocella sp.]
MSKAVAESDLSKLKARRNRFMSDVRNKSCRHLLARPHGMAQGQEFEMREQKRSMRPHEKVLLALYAFLIGIITMRAIRVRYSEWLKQRKSK